MFGDIIAVYNGTSKVAEYAYDAYGNCRVITGSNIGTLNPFRYRGYYFDEDMKLYYLQSRYYDPETGRFINADDVSYLDPETIHGLNLYAYCLNNPVMYVDETGKIGIVNYLSGKASQLFGLVVSYAIFSVASIFDKDIRNDMSAIGWNPFNKNESLVIQSNKVSFYKGQPVIKGDFPGCASFIVMFVDKGKWVKADTIRHEYGHFEQLGKMGLLKYSIRIAIPSLLSTSITDEKVYHSLPWEVTADILGDAQSYKHLRHSELIGFIYLLIATLF